MTKTSFSYLNAGSRKAFSKKLPETKAYWLFDTLGIALYLGF